MTSYSIEKRTLASGESRYKATVTVKHRSKIAQRFSKTHKKKTLATAWAKKYGVKKKLEAQQKELGYDQLHKDESQVKFAELALPIKKGWQSAYAY
ncbi:hypothetical protein [Vibrio coralliirubri]|uniref:hypothetical protein n=1 Tax=Vibrio coralliirubri TaxID=1516159 RepID=UPI00069C4EAE|nr:hypothetical protein [Vibrio coralliirubri]